MVRIYVNKAEQYKGGRGRGCVAELVSSQKGFGLQLVGSR